MAGTWRAFFSGLVAGAALAATGAVAAAAWLARQGLTATVDAGAVAADVRPAIEQQVATLLPGIIDELKRQTPPRVADELSRMLEDAGLTIYGVEIHLPPESMAGVRRQIEVVVSRELTRSLEQIDVASSARYWGEQGERILADALHAYLQGRTFEIRLGRYQPWLSLPVTIQVQRP